MGRFAHIDTKRRKRGVDGGKRVFTERNLETASTTHVLRLALDAVDVRARDNVPCLHVTIHALGEAILLTQKDAQRWVREYGRQCEADVLCLCACSSTEPIKVVERVIIAPWSKAEVGNRHGWSIEKKKKPIRVREH